MCAVHSRVSATPTLATLATPPLATMNTTNITLLTLVSTSPPVAPNFCGLSIEVPATPEMLLAPAATLLAHLYETTPAPHAGPVLRIGGNSADSSCFESNASGCKHAIQRDELQNYATFAKIAPNISYVVDVDLGRSPDPALAAAHVRALGDLGLWPLVSAVEIGNEMDIYAKATPEEQKEKGHRNQSYDYGAYEHDYSTYVPALKAAGLPTKRLQGGTYCSLSYEPPRGTFNAATNFSRYLDRFGDEMKSFSYHRYPVSHCGGENTTIGALLADASIGGQLEKLAPFIEATTKRSIEFWIGEGNSASCGGMPGVSDTFAAPLWAVDFLATLSKGGVSGMNFHGGPGGSYPPIAFDNGVLQTRPLWYGMLAFSELAANHSRWLESTASSSGMPSGGDPSCARGVSDGRVCCLSSCGTCGGTGCDKRPGGGEACCSSSIEQTGRQCDSGAAPCVLDREYRAEPVAHHAAVDAHGTLKVMLVHGAVREAAPRRLRVCAPRSAAAAAARPAQLVRLSAPSVEAKWDDEIRWGGQTWRSSRDGAPAGARATESVAGEASGGDECWSFELAPASAAMLVVAPAAAIVEA